MVAAYRAAVRYRLPNKHTAIQSVPLPDIHSAFRYFVKAKWFTTRSLWLSHRSLQKLSARTGISISRPCNVWACSLTTMFQTNSSETVTKFRNNCPETEQPNISCYEPQDCITIYMYCILLSVTATSEFSVVWFNNECWIRKDATVNCDGITGFL
jgi:hypothetical protein